MEVMMMVETDHLHHLREEFMCEPDGLTLNQFVDVMLKYLPETSDRVRMTQDLCELFAQVDVNGDGTMEWDEFSAFCIEAGMAANAFKQHNDYRFVEHLEASKLTPHSLYIQRLRYFPKINRIVACEAGNRAAKVYLPDADLASGMVVQTELRTQEITESTATNEKQLGEVLDVVHIPELKLMCCAVSDLSLVIFDAAGFESTSDEPMPLPKQVLRIHTPLAQRTIVWSSTSFTMFSVGTDPFICVWDVRPHGSPSGGLAVVEKMRLHMHTDMITDMVVINRLSPMPDILVSAGMDCQLHFWDTATLTHMTSRAEHTKGIRCLAYVEKSEILISAGFDLDMNAWDIAAMGARPLFHLIGHKYPPLGIVPLANIDQAVSVDMEGIFKWWDCRRSSSVMDMERCMQSWTTEAAIRNMKAYNPVSIARAGTSQSIVSVGGRMYFFEAVRSKPAVQPPLRALFNVQELSIFTAADGDVKVWDARTGALLREFPEIVHSEITHLSFDERHRKLIIGTQIGNVQVFNCLNGALMKEFTPHELEVSALRGCDADKCVISGSWDRTLAIHDEESADGELLRSIKNAHDADITCIAFSNELSLVATGCAAAVIKVWDFQFAFCDGVCIGHDCEVTNLVFVDPYPMLVSSDLSGRIMVWLVRPHYKRYQCVASFANQSRIPQSPLVPIPGAGDGVVGMLATYDEDSGTEIAPGIRLGRHLVITATDHGDMCVWDITPLIAVLKLTAVKESDMPKNKGNYNARRRLVRIGDGLRGAEEDTNGLGGADTRDGGSPIPVHDMAGVFEDENGLLTRSHSHSQKPPSHRPSRHATPDIAGAKSRTGSSASGRGGSFASASSNAIVVTQVVWWKAHLLGINDISLIPSPRSIMSCSQDGTLRIWALDGSFLGSLDTTHHITRKWTLTINTHDREVEERSAAADVLQSVDDARAALAASGAPTQKREFLDIDARNAHRLSMRRLAAQIAGRTADKGTLSKKRQLQAAERSRLFGQLFGEVTWQQSVAEIAKAIAQQEASKEAKGKRRKGKGKKKKRRTRKGERRDSTEATLAELMKMEAHSSEDDTGSPGPRVGRQAVDARQREATDSQNRKMYPALYDEMHRIEMKRENRIAVLARSGTSVDSTEPSEWLRQRLGLPAPVMSRRESSTPVTAAADPYGPVKSQAPAPGPATTLAPAAVPAAVPTPSSSTAASTVSTPSVSKPPLAQPVPVVTAPARVPAAGGVTPVVVPANSGSLPPPSPVRSVGTTKKLASTQPSRTPARTSGASTPAAGREARKSGASSPISTRMAATTGERDRSRSPSPKLLTQGSAPNLNATSPWTTGPHRLNRGASEQAQRLTELIAQVDQLELDGAHRKHTAARRIRARRQESMKKLRASTSGSLQTLSRAQHTQSAPVIPTTLEELSPRSRLKVLSERHGALEVHRHHATAATPIPAVRVRRESRALDELALTGELRAELSVASTTTHGSRRPSHELPPGVATPAGQPETAPEPSPPQADKLPAIGRRASADAMDPAEAERIAYMREIRKRKRFGHYSRKDVLQAKALFQRLDRDNSGTIEMAEFESDPEVSGNKNLHAHIVSMFSSLDKDGSGSLTFDELLPIFFPRATVQDARDIFALVMDRGEDEVIRKKNSKPAPLPAEIVDELRSLFNMYDTDKSNTVSLAELEAAFKRNDALYGKKAVSRMGARMSLAELMDLIGLVDIDHNRELDFEEFCSLLGEVFGATAT